MNPSSKKSFFSVWPVRGAGATGAIRLPRTGQTFSHAVGDDGYHQKGAVWPNPRFTDNGNGTVTDNLTRLVWLKDTNCVDTVGGIQRNQPIWYSVLHYEKALTWAGGLATGACGLSDGSRIGDWRLPNRLEMQSLLDYGRNKPALPVGHPFANVQQSGVWTATTLSYGSGDSSWFIHTESGVVNAATRNLHACQYYLWAVRDGAP